MLQVFVLPLPRTAHVSSVGFFADSSSTKTRMPVLPALVSQTLRISPLDVNLALPPVNA
jgi:hypothetical protein